MAGFHLVFCADPAATGIMISEAASAYKEADLLRTGDAPSGRLFCPFPYQLGLTAARRSRVGVLHFVARDRYGSLLIGPVPEPQFPKWNRENHFAADVPSPTVG